MKKLFFFMSLVCSGSLFAQQSNCNCIQVLEQLTHKIETEYPGFPDKTKDTMSYHRFKKNLSEEATRAEEAACGGILKRYTDFFKDPHLWAGFKGVPFSGEAGEGLGAISINNDDFENNARLSKDLYEGIWSNDTYTFGIKKTDENTYAGFIITSKYKEWKPGAIKFKITTDGRFEYAMLDRTVKCGDYKLINGSVLHLEEVSVALIKQLPVPVLGKEKISAILKELDGFYFKKLSGKTSILKIPSFEYQYLPMIDSLIAQNINLLEESENLIIDLRGNPGGTTDAYQKLLPYISGKTIRNTGTEFLATQTYIDNLEAYKKTLDKNTPTDAIDSNIKKLKDNLGEFVNFNKSGNTESYLEPVQTATKSPEQIIIFANGQTGSSAEYFLFIARQSKKVKIFGKPSYGALDYGNAYLVNLGCSGYQVLLPTYRALRLPEYPIDYIGIQPDIYMDRSIKDWTLFAVDYLEN